MPNPIHIVVPARYASTRLPGKPLADISGESMIVRVLQRASLAANSSCIAAVDDDRVEQAVLASGHQAVMTSQEHESGSDRVMEVADVMGWADEEIVINVQGDEPLIPPAVIDSLAEAMQSDPVLGIGTVCEPLESGFEDPNIVKVVRDSSDNALYFSRAAIPYPRDGEMAEPAMRHVGIYAFRVGALRSATSLTVGTLEVTERLEQLRWLQAGMQIRVIQALEAVPGGVDTEADLEAVRAIYEQS